MLQPNANRRLGSKSLDKIWEFAKIRGTILGVPIIRVVVCWGLYWGPPILGNYHMGGGVQNYGSLKRYYNMSNMYVEDTKVWDCIGIMYGFMGLRTSARYGSLIGVYMSHSLYSWHPPR